MSKGSTFWQNKLGLAFLIILWRPVEDDGFGPFEVHICSVGVAVLEMSCAAFWTDGTLIEKVPTPAVVPIFTSTPYTYYALRL